MWGRQGRWSNVSAKLRPCFAYKWPDDTNMYKSAELIKTYGEVTKMYAARGK